MFYPYYGIFGWLSVRSVDNLIHFVNKSVSQSDVAAAGWQSACWQQAEKCDVSGRILSKLIIVAARAIAFRSCCWLQSIWVCVAVDEPLLSWPVMASGKICELRNIEKLFRLANDLILL